MFKTVGITVSILILSSLTSVTISQQSVGTWSAYPSYNATTAVEKDKNGVIWVASNGGIYCIENHEVTHTYSVIDGLYSSSVKTITYDSENHGLWLGYIDGMLDYFDINTESFTTFSDISRTTRYTSKSINQFNWIDGNLYISTDFGLVVWDAKNHFVITSFVNFGSLGNAIRTNALVQKGDSLVVLTENGVAYGNYKTDDLILPTSWKALTNNELLLTTEPLTGTEFEGIFYLSSSTQNIRIVNSKSIIQSGMNGGVRRYIVEDAQLRAITDRSIYSISNSVPSLVYSLPNTLNRNTAFIYTNRENQAYYLGNSSLGLLSFEQNTLNDTIFPVGPFLNFFSEMKMDGEILVSASSSSPGKVASTVRESGFYLFDGEIWKSYNLSTDPIMRSSSGESFYKSAVGSNYYAFGSWGRGIAFFDKTLDSLIVYNSRNSPLPGVNASAPTFIVITGLQFDKSQTLWATTLSNLIRFIPESGTWDVFSKTALINLSDEYNGLFIDSFQQFWIPLYGSRGLLVMKFDDENPDASTGTRLTSSTEQGFLPSDEITAVAQDKRGEIWVGTTRGLVRFLFPDRIIEGNSNDRRAEYLRNVTNDTIYFRDIDVTSIAVDAANQKWIGTSANGLWQISENGDRILHQFTTSNSPLPSNLIRSVTINDRNGMVYIATSLGLLSYIDVTTRSYENKETLKVYPNPFVYEKTTHERVIIEGLTQETMIRVINPSGFIIDEFSAKGGRVQWKPQNKQGEQLSSGVYFIVAVDIDGNETAIGKLAIVR